ncbi:uncharacterized protein METZ01_LOCUS28116 [marine metagenome]|uniref:Uncharacterized protein n=1 Tax=marine metagenome TaxID=408172 RepID=A0A381Q7F2_9ZZZZ
MTVQLELQDSPVTAEGIELLSFHIGVIDRRAVAGATEVFHD